MTEKSSESKALSIGSGGRRRSEAGLAGSGNSL